MIGQSPSGGMSAGLTEDNHYCLLPLERRRKPLDGLNLVLMVPQDVFKESFTKTRTELLYELNCNFVSPAFKN